MAHSDTSQGPSSESLGAATKALADATAALTKLLSKQVTDTVLPEVSEALASGLREASRGFAGASESVQRRASERKTESRRRERADQTRAELLAAAARVVAARGYEGASVGDIATEAGYTKGALYSHFGSKEALFLELANNHLACNLAEAQRSSANNLANCYEDALRATINDPSMLLGLEIMTYGIRHPESHSSLLPSIAKSFDFLAAAVRDDRLRTERATGGSEIPLGDPEPPTQEDRDIALGISAVASFAAIYSTLGLDDSVAADAGARLIRRLLER